MKTIDYSNIHKNNIIKEARLPTSKIESGTIVRFNYKGVDAHEPRPLVLVLNPKWKNKLHGLALRVLTENELVKLSRLVKKSLATKISQRLKFNITKLNVDITNPKKFYDLKIKKFLKNTRNNAYRTYLRANITNTKIIDYRFKEMDTRVSTDIGKGFRRAKEYILKKK